MSIGLELTNSMRQYVTHSTCGIWKLHIWHWQIILKQKSLLLWSNWELNIKPNHKCVIDHSQSLKSDYDFALLHSVVILFFFSVHLENCLENLKTSTWNRSNYVHSSINTTHIMYSMLTRGKCQAHKAWLDKICKQLGWGYHRH